MMTPTKTLYVQIAENYTSNELAKLLGVSETSIKRYAKETGVQFKPKIHRHRSTEEWRKRFEDEYAGKIELTKGPIRDKQKGKWQASYKCLQCGHEWSGDLASKISAHTGCPKCNEGRHGNAYTQDEVLSMLNADFKGQWEIMEYGRYSKPESTIRCTLCGRVQEKVNLANFIRTTSRRCTQCQTGSFGEYVIANTLQYNEIPFERERKIRINNHIYRLDFLINNQIALEYSGNQHFDETTLYYREYIIENMRYKKEWAEKHGYQFVEMRYERLMTSIVQKLSEIIEMPLKTPTPEFFKKNNPTMAQTLEYMLTHSMRQTMTDLNIPSSKIKNYVRLDGYPSVLAWQLANMEKPPRKPRKHS